MTTKRKGLSLIFPVILWRFCGRGLGCRAVWCLSGGRAVVVLLQGRLRLERWRKRNFKRALRELAALRYLCVHVFSKEHLLEKQDKYLGC